MNQIKPETHKTLVKVAMQLVFMLSTPIAGYMQDLQVHETKADGDFCVASSTLPSTLYINRVEYPGVIRAFTDLKNDLKEVTGVEPLLEMDKIPQGDEIIIAGTVDHNPIIMELVKNGKLNTQTIEGKWEAFQIQVIENPYPNIKRALVIAGSDKRGTIYGIYELSKQIGVSPWHWWADVPAKKKSAIYIPSTINITSCPVVKYRGIFLNDEEPALGRWAVEKYGGFNHQIYEKLFELILRMKGNYLWPAMWWASFNSDDPLNPKLADEYGIVMGTTHHEPMMRAHAEWKRLNDGEWNYETNESALNDFWTEGIRRMNSYESIVTLAMRGDGDKAMTAETNTALLEKIVKRQREIIQNVTGKEAQKTPQLWALYKEVQDYYDKGMRVPDDVLLLLCDDNWGNIRKLPRLTDAPRKGGYGIYYHFDYVGDPRNYKWMNTNPLPRIWEQMNLAYRYGADKLWLVNVGDLKPIEFPTEFFLDYAWNPEKIKATDLSSYTEAWVKQQFGSDYSKEISTLLSKYAKYNARRKPELLNAQIYSLINYREAETVVLDYYKLQEEAERIYKAIPINYQNAYYELILHPIKACANINAMYMAQAKNKLFATQGRSSANTYADSVKSLFKQDSLYAHFYNKELADGKWNHMMDQTHISYTYWQQPDKDIVPATTYIKIQDKASMGIAVEGSENPWPLQQNLNLPEFDSRNNQKYYIEIFNKGKKQFDATIKSSAPWIKVSSTNILVQHDNRIFVTIEWSSAPVGIHKSNIKISDGKSTSVINVMINNTPAKVKGFQESNRYVSIEACHYTKAFNANAISWQILPDLGRTLSGITTFPVTAPSQKPDKTTTHLDYTINATTTGEATLFTYLSPTIDFHQNGGLKYAISIDDEVPQIINMHADKSSKAWEKSVSDNIIICVSKHVIKNAGEHTIKYWMVDSGVVVQKFVLDLGGLKPSYLGPPESFIQQ